MRLAITRNGRDMVWTDNTEDAYNCAMLLSLADSENVYQVWEDFTLHATFIKGEIQP